MARSWLDAGQSFAAADARSSPTVVGLVRTPGHEETLSSTAIWATSGHSAIHLGGKVDTHLECGSISKEQMQPAMRFEMIFKWDRQRSHSAPETGCSLPTELIKSRKTKHCTSFAPELPLSLVRHWLWPLIFISSN